MTEFRVENYGRKTFAKFIFHGNQIKTMPVENRSLSQLKVPNGAIGFFFIDVVGATIVEITSEVVTPPGETPTIKETETKKRTSVKGVDKSPMHFYGGQLFTTTDAVDKPELLDFMNMWNVSGVVKDCAGMLHPFRKNDIFVPIEAAT